MPIVFLFAAMLFFMASRVYLPLGSRISGRVVKIIGLSFQERLLLQRMNVYSIGAVLVLMTITGVMPAGGEILVVLIAFAILMAPVRCVLTTEGIGINNVVFRRWGEFATFTTSRRRLTLEGQNGSRGLALPLMAAHQNEVIPQFRLYLADQKPARQGRGRRVATAR